MAKVPSHNYDPEFRKIANAALARHLQQRPMLPKCGARAKHTGEPCRKLALANGRCHFHGGKTPKGEGYHKPRWPSRQNSKAIEKLKRKLRDLQRAEKKRSLRVAAMNPDELAAYRKWHREHAAGAPAARLLRRKLIRDGKLTAVTEHTVTEEEMRLQAEIDRLEASLRDLADEAGPTIEDDLGIFG